MSPGQNRAIQAHRVYDNKALMELLRIKDKYLKKLRDNGYLSYSREGDKYWYTQEDVDRFLRRFHYDAFATDSMLSEQQGVGAAVGGVPAAGAGDNLQSYYL